VRRPALSSYLCGERGANRVRLFEKTKNGKLWLEWRDESGRKARQSLGHFDFDRGKQQADRLAASLRLPSAKRGDTATVGELLALYLRERTPEKGEAKQYHDNAASRRFLDILGSSRPLASITHRDLAFFVKERHRRGAESRGDKKGNPIGDRVVATDLAFFRAVCNWGVNGGLLDRNPTQGYRIKENPSPNRPALSKNDYEKLLAVADSVGPHFRLALVLAHETGHRIGAIAALKWDDIDFESREISWRAETDKMRYAHTTPLSEVAVIALRESRRAKLVISQYVFPSPVDPNHHLTKPCLRSWWLLAEELAKVEHEPGRGWHSLRRRFASDLRHEPLVNLAYLGGWKRPEVIVRCYQKPDEAEMRSALDARAAKAIPG
jgi:integrase